jgi:hypothetical protein
MGDPVVHFEITARTSIVSTERYSAGKSMRIIPGINGGIGETQGMPRT